MSFENQSSKFILNTFFLICFFLIISWVVFIHSSVVSEEKGIEYTVPAGVSMKTVANDLAARHILNYPRLFELLVFFKNNKHQLKAGDYLFPKGSTPLSLLKQITTGSGMMHYTFTIVAGWNFQHVREALNREPYLEHFTTTLTDAQIIALLSHSKLKSPEGWFYPDSYFFMKGSSDLAVLKRAFQMMQEKLNKMWTARDANLPYQTQEDLLTVASLIEKETSIDAERPIIAGVIVNRLKKNMFLQIDPTVIYAMGNRYTGILHKSDLLLKNPYNTYVYKGLPPTPIAMPGLASIQAALHPKQHNYYYFVANSETSHHFSTTLAEHNQAVLMERKIKLEQGFFNYYLVRHYFLQQGAFRADEKIFNH